MIVVFISNKKNNRKPITKQILINDQRPDTTMSYNNTNKFLYILLVFSYTNLLFITLLAFN